jgi:hypothetical protein
MPALTGLEKARFHPWQKSNWLGPGRMRRRLRKNILRDFALRGVSRLKQHDGAMKLRRTKKKNMKTSKVLLLGAVITAFSFSAFAGTGAYLLKASADGNINRSADNTVTTITYVDSTSAQLTPRAASNQGKVVKGTNNDANPALECQKNMVGSPKAVTECSSHTTMPGCVKVATMK